MSKRKRSDDELGSIIYHYLHQHDYIKSAKSFVLQRNDNNPFETTEKSLLDLFPVAQLKGQDTNYINDVQSFEEEEEEEEMERRQSFEGEKERRRSASGSPFRRVDPEKWLTEVKTGLEDNSYVKTFGADGYGAKANKVLATVKGKDFRHEKTKRKRSTYRGGQISLESKSFKYDD
eukprot:CAMPEP_0173155078 /NCGR_PEP_ID=MMETSP1105-20130129/13879_1 /TAXON_ID=2985 /ORGANISM="Ochromonas sp., Strain BG-1" /LENGTH=175 /DNA_ID=CAMNT_0014071411 /DNA_START=26 /DNA_END=553 /DNA_ORIENTATION=-